MIIQSRRRDALMAGMNATMQTEDLRRQYEAEKRLADRIRAAPPAARQAETIACYGEFFRDFAAVPDPSTGRMGATANKERFLRLLLARDRRVLETGCGCGRTLAALADGQRTMAGIDVSEELLAAARQACPDAALRRMSAVNFCFPAPLFDAIYSIDVLEHLHPDDTPSHFTSVFRSLAPGGRYIVMTPHAHVGPHDVSRYFDPVPTGFHLKEYTYRDVLALGRAAGFTRASSPALPLRAYRPLPWLLRPTLFPASWKIFVERLGKQIPGRALRGRVYKALMLYTVCAVFEKPGGR